MKRWNLQIEIESDFCTSAGENAPGLINSKTALEYGVPYIPAKRIKGCLLEAGREMADNNVIDGELLYRIFGRPGMERGGKIRVGDGYLSMVPKYLFYWEGKGRIAVKSYEQFQKNIKALPEIKESLLEEIFTRRRTRTAIDEAAKTAEDHSLRTVQVVPSGIVFSSRIEGELDQEEAEILLLCVKGLRHMGIGITRGLGEIRCTLEEAQLEEPNPGEKSTLLFKDCSAEISLTYEIELEMPVVLPGGPESSAEQIPGGAVLGALAGMYIKKYSLGDHAHEDEDFSRIFLRDGVQFGNGFLKKGSNKYVPCPKAIALNKDHKTEWFNVLKPEDNHLRRKSISGQISFSEDNMYIASPQKEIHFHHARPADRGIGHALNDRAADTSVPTGQFFQYLALSKGQTFIGTWKGKAEDIKKLVECLEEHQFCLMLGKSKTAEYGSCKFRILKESPAELQSDSSIKERDWLVWLLSPLIYRNQENGAYETGSGSVLHMLREKLGSGTEILDSSCDYTVIHGYNSRWMLPTVPCPALAVGSTFRIRTEKEIYPSEIEGQRWGMLTGKGCGQFKAVPWQQALKGEVKSGVDAPDMPDTQEMDELSSEIYEYRERSLKSEGAVRKALEAMDEQGQCLPCTSDISLLIQMLKCFSDKEEYFVLMNKETERIRGKEKRERVQNFLKPCTGQSAEFMRQYLGAAKWKARYKEEQDV